MNSTKLSFEVDASQIDIKPILKKDFLELRMKAISTANPNRNNSWFTKESLEASKDSFRNKPILGYFENGDFVSHNGEWQEDPETGMDYWDTLGKKGERILGIIRSEDEIKIVEDKKGLSWICFSCALWVQYSYKQVKRLLQDAKRAKKNGESAKNISVEVDITDYEILDNGVMKINEFNLVGVTILGSRNGIKVEPGIEDAELSVVDIMGKDLYERQAQSVRLAYERLVDGSEQNKEDFSKVDNEELVPAQNAEASVEQTEENNNANFSSEENTESTIEPTNEEVETNVESNEQTAETEPTTEEHFESQEDNSEENTEENQENCDDNQEETHENYSEDPKNDEEGDDDNIEHNEENSDVCPECGKNPCICESHNMEEEPHEDESSASENSRVICDIAWLINSVSYNIASYEDTIKYYEENDIAGKEYIIPVLKRIMANDISNQKELGELMGKIASGYTEEEVQYQENLCGHCDCNELYKENCELQAKCDALEAVNKENIEKLSKYAHEEFLKHANKLLKSSKLEKEVEDQFYEECKNGSIASIEDLKVKVAVKLFDVNVKIEDEEEVLSTPIASIDTTAVFNKPVEKTKNSDPWSNLHEYTSK